MCYSHLSVASSMVTMGQWRLDHAGGRLGVRVQWVDSLGAYKVQVQVCDCPNVLLVCKHESAIHGA